MPHGRAAESCLDSEMCEEWLELCNEGVVWSLGQYHFGVHQSVLVVFCISSRINATVRD